jgi:hypothetical protein
MSQQLLWVHPMLLAVFFLLDSGSMRSHRWSFLIVTVGPFNIINRILSKQSWAHAKPSPRYPNSKGGPFNIIGINFVAQIWDFLKPMAQLPGSSGGPIQYHQQ